MSDLVQLEKKSPVINLTSRDQLEEVVLESPIPVIIDFWAPWCAPCRATGPVFEQVARELGQQVTFAKLNTEAQPELSKLFNVRSIPTLIVFYEGEVFDVRVGAANREQLHTMLRRVLDKHEGVGLLAKVKRFFKGSDEPAASNGQGPQA